MRTRWARVAVAVGLCAVACRRTPDPPPAADPPARSHATPAVPDVGRDARPGDELAGLYELARGLVGKPIAELRRYYRLDQIGTQYKLTVPDALQRHEAKRNLLAMYLEIAGDGDGERVTVAKAVLPYVDRRDVLEAYVAWLEPRWGPVHSDDHRIECEHLPAGVRVTSTSLGTLEVTVR